MMKPSAALEKAKELTGQWPHANPPDKARWLTSIASVLAQYPSALIEECCDPRRGMARSREFPPTIACIVEWCDAKMREHQLFAAYKPRLQAPPEPEYSVEHRQGMLARLSELMHSIFDVKEKEADYVRPIGRFEEADDDWNWRRLRRPIKQPEPKPAEAAE